MKTCWFVVIQANGAWWVDCEGTPYGPFASKDDAAIEGVMLARTFGDPARRAELWVRDEEDKLQQVWVGPVPLRA